MNPRPRSTHGRARQSEADKLGCVASRSGPIERISAVTLLTADMRRAAGFYSSVGFDLLYGGEDAEFTSFRVGNGYLNLQLDLNRSDPSRSDDTAIWGRVIFWVDDVDSMYLRVKSAGAEPEAPPADARWGERFFHVRDPDGHELSFARPLEQHHLEQRR